MKYGYFRTYLPICLAVLMTGIVLPIRRAEGTAISLVHTVDEYVESFSGANENTIRAKRQWAKNFLSFAERSNLYSLSDLSHTALSAFVREGLSEGYAPSTIRLRYDILRHFCKTIFGRYGIEDCSTRVHPPRASSSRPKWFDKKTGEALRLKASTERDRLIVELMFRCGLRRAEVVNLNLGNFKDSQLVNVRTKGDKFRDFPLNESVLSAIRKYLPVRQAILKKKDRSYLMLSATEQDKYPLLVSTRKTVPQQPESFRLSGETIRGVIKRVSEGQISPHQLRHSFIRDVYTSSKDILIAKQAAGHSSVQTTFRYAQPEEDEVILAIKGLE